MTLTLTKAHDVRIGDLLECQDFVWRPVENIDKQHGRLYFIFGVVSRSCLVDDIVAVGREGL